MSDEEEAMRERLSALADGELSVHECSEVLAYARTGQGQASWQAYHVIGDVLRGVAVSPTLDAAMLGRLRVQIAQEPAPARAGDALEPIAAPGGEAANASLWHWKLAAGFASLTAAVALGWTAYANLGTGAPEQGPRLAMAQPQPASGTAVQAVAALSAPSAAGAPVMIRDPRLDELLAAHRRYGATTALQMPATFLRNASFEAPPNR